MAAAQPPQVLAIVHDMPSLIGALKARRRELGLSQIAVDEIAGLQGGYTAKIECGTKNLGPVSLPCVLGALGIRLAVMRGAASQSETLAVIEGYEKKAKKHRQKIGAKGGRARVRNQTPAQRRMSAKHAAKAKWRNWRAMKAEKERKAKREGK